MRIAVWWGLWRRPSRASPGVSWQLGLLASGGHAAGTGLVEMAWKRGEVVPEIDPHPVSPLKRTPAPHRAAQWCINTEGPGWTRRPHRESGAGLPFLCWTPGRWLAAPGCSGLLFLVRGCGSLAGQPLSVSFSFFYCFELRSLVFVCVFFF